MDLNDILLEFRLCLRDAGFEYVSAAIPEKAMMCFKDRKGDISFLVVPKGNKVWVECSSKDDKHVYRDLIATNKCYCETVHNMVERCLCEVRRYSHAKNEA